MKRIEKFAYRDVLDLQGILFLLLLCNMTAARAQLQPDFTGLWKQDDARSQVKRSGDVTLRIEGRAPDFTVETTIMRGTQGARHAVQRYTTDGKVSVSMGADGDEFHTSIVREGQSLVFSIEEHEGGRILHSRETWTLKENGAVLERVRESLDAPEGDAGKRTLIYVRQASQD